MRVLVEYLWDSSRYFHYMLLVIFSAFMVLLSVYCAMHRTTNDRNVPMEIILFSGSGLLILYEILQLKFSGCSDYFNDVWNLSDIFGNLFIMSALIVIWVGNTSEGVRDWLFAISLFFGYLKWLSFFRVARSTSRWKGR